ncbi:MAG: hypothetical protein M1833_005305 [Piccolia ochrophora]|nr:MAG: hypothetical protein M1833_005305 [Piccolia ochrophora]
MNILHDHAPKQFMSSIGLFIDQIQKAEHIDLFLSQLRDEDVSKVMYKETLPRAPLLDPSGEPSAPLGPDRMDTSQHQFSSKSNRICDAFLLEFSQRKASNPQNVITAHVCKSPPNLESGLRAVGELRERDSDMLEKAVEHICFLADVNQLFDAAIGLYDLDLALLVAQQSQKDPREYLPFLQNLQKLPTLDKKFSIDDHLGRYTKALIHMHDIGNFDKFKRYTVKQQLHKEAIEICKYRQEELSEISLLYAEALEKQSQHREAAILFESLSRYQNALDCYRAASCWKEALFCAHQLGMEEPQIVAIATTLSDGLYESRDYFNAARVQIEYRQDVEAATRTFCKGYFFAEAMRVIASHTRQDLLESVLEQGLIEGFTNTTELLADCKGQLNAQTPRLRELRVKKIEDQLAYFEGTASGDIPDNVSLAATDTSTSASLFTRYSNRTDGTLNTQTTRKTSKNRRREERKRARGKKGSVYEEEYLINSVGRLIRRVNDVWEEVERLVEGLLRRGMRERALAVEKTMTEVVDLCRACVDEVFETSDDQAPEKSAEPSTRPAGADGVLWDSVGESQRKRDKPVVLPFKGSLLLSGTV